MERQDGLCAACEQPLDPDAAPNSDLYPTLDHVVPASVGGSWKLENLLVKHALCNRLRGARPPSDRDRRWQARVLPGATGETPLIYRFYDARIGQFVP